MHRRALCQTEPPSTHVVEEEDEDEEEEEENTSIMSYGASLLPPLQRCLQPA